jgi:thymidylate kinase
MQGMTIELFGLPGVGKSTATEHLLRCLHHDGVAATLAHDGFGPETNAATRIARKMGSAARAVRADPGGSAAITRALLGSRQRRAQDVPRRLLNWLAVQGLLRASAAHGGVRIFDEGVAQSLWSIALWGNAEKVLAALARAPDSWYRSDTLVFLDAPSELAHARLSRRSTSHSRIDRIALPSAQLDELRRGRSLLRTIVAWWAGVTSQAVLEIPVDARLTPQDIGRCIADAVSPRATP